MALVKCPACQSKVSEFADTCPKCNADIAGINAQAEKDKEIKLLEQDAGSLVRQEKYEEALSSLDQLLSIAPDKESIEKKIEELKAVLKEKQITESLYLAERMRDEKKYADVIQACDKVIELDPGNANAADLRKQAKEINELKKMATRKKTVIIAATVFLLAIITGVGLTAYGNWKSVQAARVEMQKGELDKAAKLLEDVKGAEILPFLSPGRSKAIVLLKNRLKLKKDVQAARDIYNKAVVRFTEQLDSGSFSGAVWDKIRTDIGAAKDAGGEFEKGLYAYRQAVLLLPAAVAESNSNTVADRVDARYQASTINGSGWHAAATKSRAAANAFQAGDAEKAEMLWNEAADMYAKTGQYAQSFREQEARVAAEAERQKKERQEALARQKAKAAAQKVNAYGRNSYAYEMAGRAERDSQWAQASEYYQLASRFKFSQSFNGRLGLTSKWRLSGDWANEYNLPRSLSQGDTVYLLVQSTSDPSIDFYLKSPHGMKEWISDRDHERIDRSGSWKVGAEAKGSVSYSIKVEVYSQN